VASTLSFLQDRSALALARRSQRADNQEDAIKSARPAVKTRSRELAAQFTAAEPLEAGEHVYRVIEVVGTSSKSISDAIDRAIARAHKTLRNLRWFEVMRTSGHIDNGKVRHYQVTLSVGFTMEEPGSG
jgi:flavin-binding protein dodecin